MLSDPRLKMPAFKTEREAKEYLVGRIVAQARREGVSLTEVERKMLYFAEAGWTLPNMSDVNEEFERDYDNHEFEQKIAGLVRRIEEANKASGWLEQEAWDDAVIKLSEGDHYLLVLLDPSFSTSGKTVRPPHDILKLWLTAFGIVFGLLVLAVLGNWLFGPRFWAVADWVFDRNRFAFFLVFAVLIWVLRSKLREVLNALLNRQ